MQRAILPALGALSVLTAVTIPSLAVAQGSDEASGTPRLTPAVVVVDAGAADRDATKAIAAISALGVGFLAVGTAARRRA